MLILIDDQMIDVVHEIIRDNPKDDFWKELDNEFLFDDIVSMCKIAGYDIFIAPTKNQEQQLLTDFLINGSERGKQMLIENNIDPDGYKNLFKSIEKALLNKE